jgi:hypothetical protein
VSKTPNFGAANAEKNKITMLQFTELVESGRVTHKKSK